MIQSIPNTLKGESPNSLPDLRWEVVSFLGLRSLLLTRSVPLCLSSKKTSWDPVVEVPNQNIKMKRISRFSGCLRASSCKSKALLRRKRPIPSKGIRCHLVKMKDKVQKSRSRRRSGKNKRASRKVGTRNSAQPSLPAPRADQAKTKAFDASRMLPLLSVQTNPKSQVSFYAICFDALLLLNVGNRIRFDLLSCLRLIASLEGKSGTLR